MARKGRRNNRKKVVGAAPVLPVTNGPTNDASLESTDALEPAVPAQTAPILPIEVIQMIAELLVEDDFTSWRALVRMTRLSRVFRAAALPVLVRDFDLEKTAWRRSLHRLLRQSPLPDAVISHIRTAKLPFDRTKSEQHALLKKIGPNLRSLSLNMRSAPTGPHTITILNTSLSEKLEALEICYLPQMKNHFEPGRPAPSTMPERLQVPSSVRKIACQFIAEGSRFEDPMEEQIWRVIGNLPKLSEWNISIDPISMRGTVISFKDFPTSKVELLSSISGPPRLLSQFAKINGFAPRSMHVWETDQLSPWTVFAGLDAFTNMTSITRLTLEKVRLDAPVLRSLPKKLRELYLLDFDTLGTIWTPFDHGTRQTFVDTLSALPEFRLLYIRGFYRGHMNFYRYKGEDNLIRSHADFWKVLAAPFAVEVKLSHYA